MTIDSRDEALVAALERNARASVVDLARQIGLSRSATQERLRKLEACGVIAGYTVRLRDRPRPARLRAWLMVRHLPGGNCSRLGPMLKNIPEVRSAFALAGDIDMLAMVEAANAEDVDRLRGLVQALPGVALVTTHVILGTPVDRAS